MPSCHKLNSFISVPSSHHSRRNEPSFLEMTTSHRKMRQLLSAVGLLPTVCCTKWPHEKRPTKYINIKKRRDVKNGNGFPFFVVALSLLFHDTVRDKPATKGSKRSDLPMAGHR
ncbi:hypothetical protein CEXT_87431 [Caerostris extrusa]|uniref:Uncharacterized protein n=1 Tax=Caerostris extrusa TaxID=172846 RepID=A0AAV4Y141_CAEEX|nr:hypothetical protein CEXT_87431 [Caerostris extrusa]